MLPHPLSGQRCRREGAEGDPSGNASNREGAKTVGVFLDCTREENRIASHHARHDNLCQKKLRTNSATTTTKKVKPAGLPCGRQPNNPPAWRGPEHIWGGCQKGNDGRKKKRTFLTHHAHANEEEESSSPSSSWHLSRRCTRKRSSAFARGANDYTTGTIGRSNKNLAGVEADFGSPHTQLQPSWNHVRRNYQNGDEEGVSGS
ncbi:hypothetical protein ZHAS_00014595 [Anopheles sinensis]|uniref:Uncharacterized protein n=1 Tax=Anopheles sinensis TaxID=74873 RepID=A0A084W8L5_ANOSI|nr:hypothetical protein ZHAS_00014595 [Anopheles sinensis]